MPDRSIVMISWSQSFRTRKNADQALWVVDEDRKVLRAYPKRTILVLETYQRGLLVGPTA